MSLAAGTRLGAYEVVSAIGAGGMGEVYRARDTRLNRDVALKILPDAFALDPERLARFQREAQILATLNHPHIAGIYGLEESGGVRFLALEFVDAGTLADRLASAPMPIDDALAVALEILDALEAAHDRGIVHRDLKPANIALTSDGRAKILDFGLAKDIGASGATSAPGATNSPTLTFAATQAGVILGTAAYMSPEQAKGRPADKRSDVWAFGCVLFEMLSGRRAFEAEDVSETLAAVLRGMPDWSLLPSATPTRVRDVLERCLIRDRKTRIPDLSVARYLLTAADSASAATRQSGQRTSSPASGALLAAGVAIAATAAALTWVATRPPAAPHRVVRLQVAPPEGTLFAVNPFEPDIAIAADASRVAFIATTSGEVFEGQLYVRELGQLGATQLPGTAGARGPVFSPDGQWIAFSQNNDFKKVSIQGGPPILLCRQCTNGFRGASWASDGSIVFSSAGGTEGLRRVSANGGEPTSIGAFDRREMAAALFPEVLPGADRVLYTATKGGLDTARIIVRDLKTGAQAVVIEGGSQPHYVPGGFLTYAVEGTVRAVRFDPARMAVSGTPVPILDHVVMKSTGAADFFISADGTLAYLAGESRLSGTTMAWIARDGATEPLPTPPHTFAVARLSPDDRRIAVDTRDADPDVWIWEFGRRILSRLTLNPAPDMYPVWSPDGQRIFFSSTRSGPRNIFVQRSDGTGGVEQLTKAARSMFPTAITPDGKTLIATKDLDGGNSDLVALSVEPDYKETPLTRTPFVEANGDISPDGRWIAYESNESGRSEIYVHPFPDFNSGRWQVSSGGGSRPLWGRSGRELFYQTLDLHLVAVPLQPGGRFNWGAAVPVLKERVFVAGPGRSYDVSADGRHVLAVTTAGAPDGRPSAAPQMTVALNWIEDLKSKAR